MTKLKNFINDSLKTESKIDCVKVNEELIKATFSILILAGNILDQIKKNVFYNKPYDTDKLMEYVKYINNEIEQLNEINVNDIVDHKREFEVNPRIFHSIVGICTESVELLEALNLYSTNIDSINIGEEFGDIDWYKAIGMDELNLEWDVILSTIIKKLKERYPNAFTSEDAINRNLNNERQILNEIKKPD